MASRRQSGSYNGLGQSNDRMRPVNNINNDDSVGFLSPGRNGSLNKSRTSAINARMEAEMEM